MHTANKKKKPKKNNKPNISSLPYPLYIITNLSFVICYNIIDDLKKKATMKMIFSFSWKRVFIKIVFISIILLV